MEFRVNLEIFRGPLDLLLYLVRKHEVEIVEIPIAPITEQFLQYLEVLQQLDINVVGDFVDMASTLIEIKSRMVLPRGGEEVDELEDPRQQLVHRLLEYKKFKDAASMLDERSRDWQQRYPRLANDLPTRQLNMAEQEIHEVELWDLVSAFGRVMRETQTTRGSSIVYDDTPIHVYMTQLHAQLQQQGRIRFSDLFQPGMHKSKLVGIFLAVLELVRHYRVKTEQNTLFGELWVVVGTGDTGPLDMSKVDNYEHGRRAADTAADNEHGEAEHDAAAEHNKDAAHATTHAEAMPPSGPAGEPGGGKKARTRKPATKRTKKAAAEKPENGDMRAADGQTPATDPSEAAETKASTPAKAKRAPRKKAAKPPADAQGE